MSKQPRFIRVNGQVYRRVEAAGLQQDTIDMWAEEVKGLIATLEQLTNGKDGLAYVLWDNVAGSVGGDIGSALSEKAHEGMQSLNTAKKLYQQYLETLKKAGVQQD